MCRKGRRDGEYSRAASRRGPVISKINDNVQHTWGNGNVAPVLLGVWQCRAYIIGDVRGIHVAFLDTGTQQEKKLKLKFRRCECRVRKRRPHTRSG